VLSNVKRLLSVLVIALLMASTNAGAATPAGIEHLTIFAVNTDGPKFEAIVSGDIADYGSAVSNQRNTELTLHLTKGTFSVDVATLDAKLVAESADEPLFASTCSDYFKVSGMITIIAKSGTGTYRRIAGTFDSSITVNEDQGPPCKHSLALFRQIFFLDGIGHVSG